MGALFFDSRLSTLSLFFFPQKYYTPSSKVKKNTKFHACGEKNGWVMVIDLDERFYGYIKSSNLGSYGFGDNSKRSELYVNYFKVWPFK